MISGLCVLECAAKGFRSPIINLRLVLQTCHGHVESGMCRSFMGTSGSCTVGFEAALLLILW